MTPLPPYHHHPRRRTSVPALRLLLLSALHLAAEVAFAEHSGVTPGTVILRRTADDGKIAAALTAAAAGENPAAALPPCKYDGGYLTLAHPMSLKSTDKFFSTGQLQMRAMEMMVDEINTSPRCGVGVGGRRYGLTLDSYGDDSDKAKTSAIANAVVQGADFLLGPYSSGLTGMVAPVANSTNKVLLAGGAASTAVFNDRPTVFGTFPPTKSYLAQAIKGLAEAGAKSAVGIWEDASFTRGVCAALPSLAAEHGLKMRGEYEVPASPTAEHFDSLARNLSVPELNPDVVVTCVYDSGCAEWVRSMRRADWSPRAQVFTVCIGMGTFEENVGTDAEYMMGVSPWDKSLPIEDAVTGWSAKKFYDSFYDSTQRTATYHAASAASSLGILVQAMEKADSLNTDTVTEVLRQEEFTTLYGAISFDSNGQSQAPALMLQYDSNMDVQTVYPAAQSSGELLYPMPTWAFRDCVKLSDCGSIASSECKPDGTCACSNDNDVSIGAGANATCRTIPEEDMTYISITLKYVGITLVVLQGVLSFGFASWTYWNRSKTIVRVSQPIFLGLVCLGTFVLACAILPSGVEGEYRYLQNPVTGQLTDIPNPDINRVDAACMAFPWLAGCGFVVVFSALFAKIWRVKKIFKNSGNLRRKQVQVKDVMGIMAGMFAIEFVMLLAWQLVAPLRWQRTVLETDVNGHPTKSVGKCTSELETAFLAPLLAFNGGCLVYALYLCYVTRNFPDEFASGKWITASVASIFQILLLAVPVLVIVQADTNTHYFVQSAILFVMSSTVSLFIFLPKIYNLHFQPNSPNSARELVNKARDSVSKNPSGLINASVAKCSQQSIHASDTCSVSSLRRRVENSKASVASESDRSNNDVLPRESSDASAGAAGSVLVSSGRPFSFRRNSTQHSEEELNDVGLGLSAEASSRRLSDLSMDDAVMEVCSDDEGGSQADHDEGAELPVAHTSTTKDGTARGSVLRSSSVSSFISSGRRVSFLNDADEQEGPLIDDEGGLSSRCNGDGGGGGKRTCKEEATARSAGEATDAFRDDDYEAADNV